MQKVLWIVVLLSCWSGDLRSQVLYKAIDFKVATPYLEPDARDLSLKLNNEEFISLAKTKGGIFGESSYLLEKYNKELSVVFSVQLKVPMEEDFFKLVHSGENVWLFSAVHNTQTLVAQCKLYQYSTADGKLVGETILSEVKVNPWTKEMSKAVVSEEFETTVTACQPRDFVTPLEYIYQLEFSPDKKKFMVYIYDYSKKTLVAQAAIYDDQLKPLSKGIVPIDNNFISYGLYLNNRGEVFILNADKIGRLALIRYNIDTRENIFLDIASSATKRYNFKLRFLNDDEVYVMNLSARSNKLSGFMYSKFNFKEKSIDKINHHDLSEGIMQTSKVLRANNKAYDAEDDWMHYNITDVYLNEYEKIIVVIEKQEIVSAMFNFVPYPVNALENWYDKAGRVNTGPLIMYSFNNEDLLLWESYNLKSQSNDISAGLLSASYAMAVTDDGKILMAFASSSNSTGLYNEINYWQFEEASGSKVKNIRLENKESFSLLKDYTVWFDDAVVFGARKGVFGKKSNLVRYNYNVE